MTIKKISNEEKALFYLSQPFLKQNNIEKTWSTLFQNNDLNFEKIHRLSINNEVSGFIYKNSKGTELFPDKIKNDLSQFYKDTALKNMFALKEFLGVLNILSKNKISVVPLKGVFASDLIFNDFGVYPSGDIDILVRPSDLFKSRDILCGQGGFSLIQDFSEQDLLANHYHLNLKKNMLLEIHWNLVKRYFNIPADFWWESAEPIMWNKINVSELSIENHILYSVFRLFDHCFYPLRFFVLLVAIVEKNDTDIDWNNLLKTADQFKMKKLLVFTLKILHDLFDTQLPQLIIKEHFVGYKYLKSLVLSGINSGVEHKHLRMMFYTLLIIDPLTVIKVFAERVFPSKGELRLRYNLPPESKKVYFYYILNPFLLLMRSKKE